MINQFKGRRRKGALQCFFGSSNYRSMGGSDKPKMILLNASSYGIWKTKMMDLLNVKKLARPIEELGIRLVGSIVQEWSELDRRCLRFIRQYIYKWVIHHVENSTIAYACWTKLQG